MLPKLPSSLNLVSILFYPPLSIHNTILEREVCERGERLLHFRILPTSYLTYSLESALTSVSQFLTQFANTSSTHLSPPARIFFLCLMFPIAKTWKTNLISATFVLCVTKFQGRKRGDQATDPITFSRQNHLIKESD